MPGDRGAAMDNEHWIMAARARLGLLRRPAEARWCCLPTAKGQRGCPEELDEAMIHPQLCNAGPAHKRTHRALAMALCSQLRRAGAVCDIERHEPGWKRLNKRGEAVDGYSDVRAAWPGSARVFRIDVTVRSPHARRYEGAGERAAVAAEAATAEKEALYGDTVDVMPFESYGRLGPAGIALTAELAEEARQWGPLQLRVPVGLPVRALRVALEGAVVRAQADVTLLAAGALSDRALGWKPRPRPAAARAGRAERGTAPAAARAPRALAPAALWERRLPLGGAAEASAGAATAEAATADGGARRLPRGQGSQHGTLDGWLAAAREEEATTRADSDAGSEASEGADSGPDSSLHGG